MSKGREEVRKQLAELGRKGRETRGRRTAESIAGEAYHSSRIEGCKVDYPSMVKTAKTMMAESRRR
jgi:hypothetical protein